MPIATMEASYALIASSGGTDFFGSTTFLFCDIPDSNQTFDQIDYAAMLLCHPYLAWSRCNYQFVFLTKYGKLL